MGRFSTTVHIKNNVDRMRFVDTFSDIMKKRGFVQCSEDEATQSYMFAYGDGWVTLANEEYKDNPQKAYDDTRAMAQALKTSAFSVEVVDSDFATLTLNNGDHVIVGDGTGYGIEDTQKGNKELWDSVLKEYGIWEQLFQIWEKNNVFVEDVLYDSAPVFGIKSEYMTVDYEELSSKVVTDKNIASLYFKKTAEAKSKSLSLNATFVRVFGEALEPLGFKKIKGRQPYFIRVVPGDEIIHVITVAKKSSYLRAIGREGFTILSGAATVYRPKIDLSVAPKDNARWLSEIMSTYIGMNRFSFDSNLADCLSGLSFLEKNCESQFEAMELALEHTKNIVIPALNKAVDIDSFARFCLMMNGELHLERHFDMLRNGKLRPNYVDDEGLVLIKVKDYPNYVDWNVEYRKLTYSKRVEYKFDKYSENDYADFCNNIGKYKQKYISEMSKIRNDTQVYDMIEFELEKRRRLNIETLRSFGIDI